MSTLYAQGLIPTAVDNAIESTPGLYNLRVILGFLFAVLIRAEKQPETAEGSLRWRQVYDDTKKLTTTALSVAEGRIQFGLTQTVDGLLWRGLRQNLERLVNRYEFEARQTTLAQEV